MKFSQLILLVLISTGLAIVSCKDSADESKTETPASVSPNANPAEDAGVMQPTSPGNIAVQPGGAAATGGTTSGGAKEHHYICQTEGCTGNSMSQGKCPICNADLVHNQAYHSQNNSGGANTNAATPVMIDPATGKPTTANPATPPSAQNASGEYHYACPAGHPGGAMAGKCSTCGAELTHNSAYHNK